MESKYFTPDIEDLRIGYECEIHTMTTGGLMMMDFSEGTSEMLKEPSIKCWEQVRCGLDVWYDKTPKQLIEFLEEDRVRTPYLTKEQIEAEGWKTLEFKREGLYGYEKANYFLVFNEKIRTINIILRDPSKESEISWSVQMSPEHFNFFCECKCINTFRTICKLLNIK